VSYYSDNGVDRAIEQYLPEFGYAADVGANNGTFGSNSLCFEEKGWIVLCIEPNPLLEEDGRLKRRLWRTVACAAEDCEAHPFAAVGGAPYASSSALIRAGSPGPETAQVICRRLDRVLEEAGFPRLDYLTVDVESWEDEVMAGFTIERWKPTIIVLESWDDKQSVPAGYERIERRAFDNIYKRLPPPENEPIA
jgi:FkbM family methyltransferase